MSATLTGARRPAGNTLAALCVGLVAGLVLVSTPATVLLLLPMLAPSILVRVLDDRPDRAVFRAILACNLAASIDPVVGLWRGGVPRLDRAVAMLAEPGVLCTAWLAASSAWILSEVVTVVADRVLALRDATLDVRLTAEIDRLRAEWGPETDRPDT